jgi:PAS domain S-box-containing protein
MDQRIDIYQLAESVFDAFPLGVVVYRLVNPEDDRSLRLIYANKANEEITGIQADEILGHAIDKAFPSAREMGLSQRYAEVVRSKKPLRIKDLYYADHRIEGEWFDVTAFPLLEDCVGVVSDKVTEGKRTEQKAEAAVKKHKTEAEARRQAETRLSQIAGEWAATFDAIPTYLSVVEKDFRLRRVNRAFAELLSCEPSDLVGKLCYEVVHGLDHPWPDCPHLQTMQEHRTVTEEVNDPRIGLPLQVTCSPCLNKKGEVVGSVHIARDISAQIQAMDERDVLIAKLQQALANVRLLSGFLPICGGCKKIRDDSGYWQQIESYIRDHSEAEFSHGLCPDCMKRMYPDFADEDD